MTSKHKHLFYNIVFISGCAALLLFLLYAPPGTTARLPSDQNHEPFMTMGKKEAEKFCMACHGPGTLKPLPEIHPPSYRCLFCHKRK